MRAACDTFNKEECPRRCAWSASTSQCRQVLSCTTFTNHDDCPRRCFWDGANGDCTDAPTTREGKSEPSSASESEDLDPVALVGIIAAMVTILAPCIACIAGAAQLALNRPPWWVRLA